MIETNSSPETIDPVSRLKVRIADIMLSTDGELPTHWPTFSTDDKKREGELVNSFIPGDIDSSTFKAAIEQAVPTDISIPGESPQVHY